MSDPGRRTTMAPAEPVAAKELGATIKGLLARRVAFDIEVATQGADVTYSHAGERLVAHSTRGPDATPAYVRAFVQFIRYRFGGHADDELDGRSIGTVPTKVALRDLDEGVGAVEGRAGGRGRGRGRGYRRRLRGNAMCLPTLLLRI